MKQILVCIVAIVAAMVLVCTGCESPSDDPGSKDTAVAFTGLSADGSDTATTTKLTLTFDKDITDLVAGDITLTSTTSMTKGTLTKQAGTGVYELTVSGITSGGPITVTVSKGGYTISPVSKNVTVFYYSDPNAIAVAFSNLTANGSSTTTTTTLTLTFDKDIAGLVETDIILTAGFTGAIKGTLTKVSGSTGVYELTVGSITANGQITVAVSKSGYTISPASRNVNVFYYFDPGAIAVTFSGLTANGSATATTTKLTLTFDKDITGLAEGDITLTAGSTGTTRGILTKVSENTGVYELTVSSITANGQVTVAVSKSGYTINPTSRNVNVVYYLDPSAIEVTFSGLTANGSATATTTALTLTFDKDITGLAEGDIILTAGSTGTTRGILTKVSENTGVYELAVSGITATGQVTVAVSKDGYTISPTNRNASVFYYTTSGTDDPNAGIEIGNPGIKLYLDGNTSSLQEGGSTQISQGAGTYTVSIASGTYTSIIWYLNGSIVLQGATETSIMLSKQTAGTYMVTVEAVPTGGQKNSGSHSFVVQ
jgi:predicted  nucleic acid-binding Zn-ribbon protein